MTVLIILGGLAFVFAFFTATLGYLRAKIAAAERELQAEEDRAREIDAPTSELRR